MKGFVFTEFVEWVEESWSRDLADDVIDGSELASGGAYTSVGTYNHREILTLVGTLAQRVELPANTLVRSFGQWLFPKLAGAHPGALEATGSTFDLLERLEDHIHPAVLKLYADAEVPRFHAERSGPELTLRYRSSRPFADLAEGLILGAAAWFGERLDLQRSENADGTTQFQLRVAQHDDG